MARAFAVLALAAIFNLTLAPLLRAASPPGSAASVEDVAADLKATFGDAFQLCVDVGLDGSIPIAPHHGDEGCPLCCLHGAAHLLAPEGNSLPLRFAVRMALGVPSRDAALPPPSRTSPAQPRAPPRL